LAGVQDALGWRDRHRSFSVIFHRNDNPQLIPKNDLSRIWRGKEIDRNCAIRSSSSHTGEGRHDEFGKYEEAD
jgi:hypothetical protein